MGLIKAFTGAGGGVLADQWKEYFYCDALDEDTLMVKASKRTSGRGSNTKGVDNIITKGSVFAVADGQCMLIVDQGKVAEVCAEPGEYTYDASTEPSVFAGDFGEGLIESFKNFGKRFTFGGEAPKDQRVYYVNTKEIMGNKYGTPSPVPYRVVDRNVNLDLEIGLRCFGEYSYRIVDPIVFYQKIAGNAASGYTRDRLDSQLKSDVLTALQPAFGRLAEQGLRYYALTSHTMELAKAMNEILGADWAAKRGIAIVNFGISSVKASEEDEKLIKDLQRTAALRDPGLAGATMVQAQADAMRAAAANQNAGPAMAFMGMNMAAQAGGINANTFYQMAAQQPKAQPAAPAAPAAAGWKCACGHENTGKFCTECGAKKPEEGWVCSCGSVNKGKFCPECGAKRPAAAPVYQCDKCGWKPEDPMNPPRFCPECGDPFNDADAI